MSMHDLLTGRSRTRLAVAAAAIAPMSVLLTVRGTFTSEATASVSAPVLEPDAIVSDFQPPSIAVEVTRARQFAETREARVFGKSPMIGDRQTGVEVVEVSVPPQAGEPVPEVSSDSFVLTSILGGRRPVAVINGNAARLDDELEGGWRVSQIDVARRVVVLTHPLSLPVELQWDLAGR
ncbi:MAG: hypothetical protein AAGG07_13000 [Planctomycetota bacterium]